MAPDKKQKRPPTKATFHKRPDGYAELTFRVAGVRMGPSNEGRLDNLFWLYRQHIENAEAPVRVFFARDKHNQYDKNAVKVTTKQPASLIEVRRTTVGFVPRHVAPTVAKRLDNGMELFAEVQEFTKYAGNVVGAIIKVTWPTRSAWRHVRNGGLYVADVDAPTRE